MTLPSDAISQCACAGPRPPPPHVQIATPMPVLIGPGVLSPVGCRLSQPNSAAPSRRYAPPHRVRRFGRQVLDPELDRIHLHLVGELVHHDLGDERALRMTRRAHRPLLAGVDEDVLVRPAAIRDPVDVRQREAGGRAGAARAPRLGVERRDDAVGRDAGLDPRRRRRPVAGREMLFLAIEHQLDRRVRLPSRAARRSGPRRRRSTPCCRSRRPCTGR